MPSVSGCEEAACRRESGKPFLNPSITLPPPVVCDNLELHSRSPGELIGSLFFDHETHESKQWVLPDVIRDERSEQEVSAAGAERFGT